MTGAQIEAEVLDWLTGNWSPDLTLREWWGRLADSGWGFPMWPTSHFGRGLPKHEAASVSRAFRAAGRAGSIGAPTGLGSLMGGPVLLDYGTEEQKARLLPPLCRGEEGWCQLFSEPGAGSDLASVTTRAERDGDEWIVTGQKVWTSGAHHSRRGMLVARTNVDVPKHRGLTYFLLDLDQPGVEVRPLHQMNGKSHFSEVFLTEARVHDRDRIGDVDNGWMVTTATLAYERSGLSAAEGGVRPAAGELAGQLDRTAGSLVSEAQGRVDEDEAAPGTYASLLNATRAQGLADDPTIRQDLARLYTYERIADASRRRSAAAAKAGRAPGPESSIAKLFWTNSLRHSSNLAMRILGPWGTVRADSGPEMHRRAQTYFLSVPSASIAGGTDEIQRNIIGERTLALPREPSHDADVAFKDLAKS
jgi:alkylation response protein AidB-like acyl-CoA dehydrogenase